MKKLGEILVEQGSTTPEVVEQALQVQQRPHEARKIGEILVGRGLVKRHHVDIALAKQRRP
jgi:hypothetical protein